MTQTIDEGAGGFCEGEEGKGERCMNELVAIFCPFFPTFLFLLDLLIT